MTLGHDGRGLEPFYRRQTFPPIRPLLAAVPFLKHDAHGYFVDRGAKKI